MSGNKEYHIMKQFTYTFQIERQDTGESLGEVKVQANSYLEADNKMLTYLMSNRAPHDAIISGMATRTENVQHVGVVELE